MGETAHSANGLALSLRSLGLRRPTTERVEAPRQEADLAQRFVRQAEDHGPGWFWRTDRHGRMVYLSEKVARELGVPQGAALQEFLTADHESEHHQRTLNFHLSSRTAFTDYPVRPVRRLIDERLWSMSGRPVQDDAGEFDGFIGFGSDMTAKRRSEAEIARLALFDSLTGLANRQRMRLSLDQTLLQGARCRRSTSLLLLDLDRFKQVNDTLGHQVGDALLRQVAQRLQRAVGEDALVGRLGGDEFQLIVPGEEDRQRLSFIASEIIADLSQPYSVDGVSLTIGCSIGVAVAPEQGENAETLVRNADLALYAAKADGRGVHRFFQEEMLVGARGRKQLEDDLRVALKDGQFHMAYQPVVSTRSEEIVGYEALLRWTHPTRGAISPAEFVPIAEDCGLIEAIGEWVLRTATAEAAGWPAGVRVAVNVSPIQFANPALPGIVTSALAASGLAPERLELEITEGVFLNDTAEAETMFKRLKGIGVRLALDDFGTGYSSLGYLKKAPFDKIKIDQSFVRGAAVPGNRNAAIIKAIVTLAETLGMETTAEGVEVQDEILLIRDLGCSHIQGYVYGKPVPAEAAREQLSAQGGMARAEGFRVSRSPRSTMLRWATLQVAGHRAEVRIRNLSSTGAMVDGVDPDVTSVDSEVAIELLENEMMPARVRWVRDGKAGLEFFGLFNMERLATAPRRLLRRA